MNGHDLVSHSRHQLSDAITDFQPPPFYPLNVSPWIAMALLQKSVRRGRKQAALRATATLLHQTPERLWRRCGCIAFEDIGVTDLDTVAIVTAALAGKRFRAGLGGEWHVASYIVSRMVRAPKCRSADDLLLTAENHPAYERARLDLAFRTTADLIDIASSSAPLPVRALALWYAIGTDRRPSPRLRLRRGDPAAVFDALCEAGVPHTVVEIAREGHRKVGEVLAPFVALLCPLRVGETTITGDDEFPPETLIGDIPGWAYDLYSREGRAALAAFVDGPSATAQWVRAHIPSRQRVGFLGGIVFRVEGQLVRSRLRWPTGDELRRLVDIECSGPHCPDATEVLELTRADIPVLNGVRAEMMRGAYHD